MNQLNRFGIAAAAAAAMSFVSLHAAQYPSTPLGASGGAPAASQHIVETQNGTTVLDLTVTNTNTYNPYVIMPIPANVKNAGPAGARSN